MRAATTTLARDGALTRRHDSYDTRSHWRWLFTTAHGRQRWRNVFMNEFRRPGFIDYNGGLKINDSLLNVVLRN